MEECMIGALYCTSLSSHRDFVYCALRMQRRCKCSGWLALANISEILHNSAAGMRTVIIPANRKEIPHSTFRSILHQARLIEENFL